MGKVIWKEVLIPGTYRVGGREFTFTPDDANRAARHGKAMLSQGLAVPFAWDHDPNAYPMMSKGSWLSRGYFGEAKDFKTKDGRLYVKVDIADPADAAQFDKVGRVSPGMSLNFTDERGQTFPGWSVTHVAATPRPRQRDISRESFANLSLPVGVRAESVVYMGYSEESAEGHTNQPERAMDEELIQLLASCGVNVGDGVKDVEDLKGRLKAVAANKAAPTEPDGDENLDLPDPNDTNPAASGNVLMSQATSKANAKLIAADKRQLNGRIAEMVSKGLDPKYGKKLQTELDKADLSYGDDGNLVQVPVLIKIESAAELMTTKGWTATSSANLSHDTSPVDDPVQLEGPDGPAAIEAAKEYALTRKLPGQK